MPAQHHPTEPSPVLIIAVYDDRDHEIFFNVTKALERNRENALRLFVDDDVECPLADRVSTIKAQPSAGKFDGYSPVKRTQEGKRRTARVIEFVELLTVPSGHGAGKSFKLAIWRPSHSRQAKVNEGRYQRPPRQRYRW